MDIGEIRRVDILKNQDDDNTHIELLAWIGQSLLIPKGSAAYVNTLGLLGEKYIEIIPPAQVEDYFRPGEMVIGTDPIMLHHWIDEGEKIVGDLRDLLHKLKQDEGTIGKLINDDGLYLELEALIGDIRQARGGTIGKLLYDDKLYNELEALVSDLRRNPWKLFWKSKERR